MSRTDELMKQMCPRGVPHRTLGEVGESSVGEWAPEEKFA